MCACLDNIWGCLCWTFAVNYNLDTDALQKVVDALPHLRMQRLIFGGTFLRTMCDPQSSPVWRVGGGAHPVAAHCGLFAVM
mgnify:CR=1 FL=1